MKGIERGPAPAPTEDTAVVGWAEWLTARRAILFVIGWLGAFALFSVLLSNPFQSEPSASAAPSYANVMYLHGLLVGMVGLAALLTLAVFRLRSPHLRAAIVLGVVAATVLASIGGVFDRQIPGAEVPMWTQVAGFFALDEILLALIIGLLRERVTVLAAGFLPWFAALAAAGAMATAAVMGHVAGWTMEFGENFPSLLGSYRQWAGFGKQGDFVSALVGSHSHEMAVGAMALAVTLMAVQFGYASVTGAGRVLSRVGLGMVGAGTVLMGAFYVVTGISSWAPPAALAQVGSGPNVIPLDDLLTGIGVMGGGLLVALGLAGRMLHKPERLAAAWSYVLAVATVAVAGYTIELHSSYFGAGDPKAAGAAADGIFTWLHQDLGLFLLPTLLVVMLAAERLVASRARRDAIGITALAGTTLLFAGAMVWVFVDPVLHGTGYAVSAIGALVTGTAVLATIWSAGLGWRVRRRGRGTLRAARPSWGG
jgi:hypothetical protein